MIAYGYFLRGRYLRERIEQYWMSGGDHPSLDDIKGDIFKYDHGKSMPTTNRSLIKGQLYSGFIPTLVAASVLLGIEFHLELSWRHCLILVGFAGYVIWEMFALARYDQMKPAQKYD